MSLHRQTTLPGADAIPILIRAASDLARRRLGAPVDQYRMLAQQTGLGIIVDLWALGFVEENGQIRRLRPRWCPVSFS